MVPAAPPDLYRDRRRGASRDPGSWIFIGQPSGAAACGKPTRPAGAS